MDPEGQSIADRLQRVRDEVAEACRLAGRRPDTVALMAVSKVHPVELLVEAYGAGQRLFGENRVQEWQGKAPVVAALQGLEMHLIGPLQSNKTGRAAELFAGVDTVDSLRVAQRLDAAAGALGRRLPVMVEVKLSPEESKHGVAPSELPELIEGLAGLGNLEVTGLMTVPPWPDDVSRAGELARPYFVRLRELGEEARRVIPGCIGLSMGMSNDFAAAVEEGSTCVRVGTAIFGVRPKG